MTKKTLFLDRDGVINRRIVDGYVCHVNEFEFLPGTLKAIADLSSQFDYIFIVTNQQGIGKGFITENNLTEIHNFLLEQVTKTGGRIDKIYVCPDLSDSNSSNRKPNTGMALQAQHDFPDLDFTTAVMIGDSISDMQFGKKLGMKTVFITNGKAFPKETLHMADKVVVDLLEASKLVF